MGFVSDIVGGATDFLTGSGGSSSTQSRSVPTMTPEERARLQGIESELIGMGGNVNPAIAQYKQGLSTKQVKVDELMSLWNERPGARGYKLGNNKSGLTKAQVSSKIDNLLNELGLPNWDDVRFGDAEKLKAQISSEINMGDDAIANKLGVPLYLGGSRPGVDESAAQPYGSQTEMLQKMFKDILTKSIASDMAGGTYNPEQLANATKFVDDTFTKSAQVALDDFSNQQRERAAALGRDPNLDQQTSSQIADATARLGAERGARIAGRIEETGLRALQNAMGGSAAAGQMDLTKSGFLNDLAQRAYNNRLTLLNARSGIGDKYSNERYQNVTNTIFTPGQDGGLLGDLSSITSGISGLGTSVMGLGNLGSSAFKGLKDFMGGGTGNIISDANPYAYGERSGTRGTNVF